MPCAERRGQRTTSSHRYTSAAVSLIPMEPMEGRSSFPVKLHACLTELEHTEQSHVASFQPHGRAIMVHKQDDFLAVLPRWFNITKIESFQRQLNLYGFQRITKGPDKHAYYHPLFQRGHAAWAARIPRLGTKGAGPRKTVECCPDFTVAAALTGNELRQAVMHPGATVFSNTVPLGMAETIMNRLAPQPAVYPVATEAPFRFVHPGSVSALSQTAPGPLHAPMYASRRDATSLTDQLAMEASLTEHRAAMLALSMDLNRQQQQRELQQLLHQQQTQALEQRLRQRQQQQLQLIQQGLEQRRSLMAPSITDSLLHAFHSQPLNHPFQASSLSLPLSLGNGQQVGLARQYDSNSLVPQVIQGHPPQTELDHLILTLSQRRFEAATHNQGGSASRLPSSHSH